MAPKRKRTKVKLVKLSKTKELPPCRLLQLPRELRDAIWITVLSSTRLAHGNIGRVAYPKPVKPAPFSLSILRVCKQINEETKTLWLNHVLFHFEDAETLLDKLWPLPLATLSQIRYLRLVQCPFVMQPWGEGSDNRDAHYRPAAVFMMLPGLRLERLTILGPQAEGWDSTAYDTLRALIVEGNGWKELHYLMPHSRILGFASAPFLTFSMDYLRKPQPADFTEKLIQRDGADSRASVTIFRSTVVGAPDAVMNPSTREIVDQKILPSTNLDTFGLQEDQNFTAEEKSLLVAVKRGRDADVSEPTGPPYSPEDIREWAYGISWPTIKRICFAWRDEEHSDEGSYRDSSPLLDSDGEEIEIPESPKPIREVQLKIDAYNNVDEFDRTDRWP